MVRRGRILRVKEGYNPNSSSVGSAIPVFLYVAGGAAAATAVVLAVFGRVRKRLRRGDDEKR